MRNRRVFEEKFATMEEVWHMIVQSTWEWCVGDVRVKGIMGEDLICNWSGVIVA